MNFDQIKASRTLESIIFGFPNLRETLKEMKGDVLIIGAMILHFYKSQGWINHARATGDIDLSIGVTPNLDEYSTIKAMLLSKGYRVDDEMKYRLVLPATKIQPQVKIDLLVHPKENFDEASARELMGVASEWNFEGIRYGLLGSHPIHENIFVPNPIGFLGLKGFSYHTDPRRVRDLVDICDVIKGLVSAGNHYELAKTYRDMASQNTRGHLFLTRMMKELTNPESQAWDLGRARQEFLQRGYSEAEIDGDMHHIVKAFIEAF